MSGTGVLTAATKLVAWLDRRRGALESLTAIARAGADVIVTYMAADAARWLSEGEA